VLKSRKEFFKDLNIYTDCLLNLVDGLKKALQTSNENWSRIDDDIKFFAKQTFLIPIIFYYKYGCADIPSQSNIVSGSESRIKSFLKLDHTIRKTNHAATDILNFEEEPSFNSLECILISPISFGH